MNILNNNLGIEDRIWQELMSKNVSCAKIVLTATGLNKSIIDASKTIRLFLIESGIHNFELQAKGLVNKKNIAINIVKEDSVQKTIMSLYRPETNNGSPRFWISGLQHYANPNDTLLFFLYKETLHVANISLISIRGGRNSTDALFQIMFSDLLSSVEIISKKSDLNMTRSENKFINDLLDLQQDGSGAISAPSNWVNQKPLLKVDTALDQHVNDLLNEIDTNVNKADSILWHFFIGSPGNGKSAAAGSLARALLERGCAIVDEDGSNLEDIPSSKIPYLLKVFRGDDKHASIWIAQDASVVRNPFASGADPSKELFDLIKDAAKQSVTLVICTNRGVLEKASRIAGLSKDELDKTVSTAIKKAVEGSESTSLTLGTKKGTPIKVKITSYNLEVQSLFFSSDDTAKKVITLAVSDKNWKDCADCASAHMCPFFNNKKWFATDDGSTTILSVLRYAELLSGQLIVFREFLAILSLLLAGCPNDYGDDTPCKWVHQKVEEDDLFALVARRSYMLLFSSYAPAGLEYSEELRNEQIRFLEEVLEVISADSITSIHKKLAIVLDRPDDFVSTDVGTQRLLERDGVLAMLDVINCPLPQEFMTKWSTNVQTIESLPIGLDSDLEKKLIHFLNSLATAIEDTSSLSGKHFFWLSRWRTSFLFRIGSLAENRFSLGSEISQLVNVLNGSKEGVDDPELLQPVQQIEEALNALLLGASSGIKISEYGRLKGKWVIDNLGLRIEPQGRVAMLGVPIQFGKNNTELLYAQAFIWLLRKVNTSMVFKSFPVHHLDSIQDALVRAAVSGGYSVARDDIDLEILGPKSQISHLKRFRGVVSVEN